MPSFVYIYIHMNDTYAHRRAKEAGCRNEARIERADLQRSEAPARFAAEEHVAQFRVLVHLCCSVCCSASESACVAVGFAVGVAVSEGRCVKNMLRRFESLYLDVTWLIYVCDMTYSCV